jgi:hypothetical protein
MRTSTCSGAPSRLRNDVAPRLARIAGPEWIEEHPVEDQLQFVRALDVPMGLHFDGNESAFGAIDAVRPPVDLESIVPVVRDVVDDDVAVEDLGEISGSDVELDGAGFDLVLELDPLTVSSSTVSSKETSPRSKSTKA